MIKIFCLYFFVRKAGSPDKQLEFICLFYWNKIKICNTEKVTSLIINYKLNVIISFVNSCTSKVVAVVVLSKTFKNRKIT